MSVNGNNKKDVSREQNIMPRPKFLKYDVLGTFSFAV